MAVVSIPETDRTIRDAQELKQFLASINIDYERWEPAHTVAADAPAAEILAAYAPEIERPQYQAGLRAPVRSVGLSYGWNAGGRCPHRKK